MRSEIRLFPKSRNGQARSLQRERNVKGPCTENRARAFCYKIKIQMCRTVVLVSICWNFRAAVFSGR